ncbi:hypothetical protein Tco_1398150, partial [Tanacetum coccineum]
NTLAEYMILYGADNHPPMLDKDLYDSWKKNGVTKTKKYDELSPAVKIQADCDMKTSNIILQGLPTDIYSLVNHHRFAKDLWEKGRQNSYAAGTSGTRANTLGIGGNYSGQQRIVKCFNCQGEAQENGKVLIEEELEFLADHRIAEGPVTPSVITHNAAYQADDLDAYDSNCDEISTAKVVLIANLSSYGSDVLSKVLIFDNTNNDMLNQSVQEMPYSEPSYFVEHSENEIHNALILSVFEQLSNQVTNCNKVNNDNLIANETLSAELERYKNRVKLLEERQNVDLGTQENLIIDDIIQEKNAQFADFEKEINNLKQTLSEQSKEKELLTKTFNVFKNESKEKEAKNIDTEIALEKKVKELENIVCNMGQSAQTVHMLTKS